MEQPIILLAGLLAGAFAGWLYGRIGFSLMLQEERARSDKSLKAPGLRDYFMGWVLPVLVGFGAFILGFIGFSGVPQPGEQMQGSPLANPGLIYVLIAEAVGVGFGRMALKS